MSLGGARFTPLQRLLHWFMAAAILATLFIGVGMVSTVQPKYVRLLAMHESLGFVILVFAVFRLMTRLREGAPTLPESIPAPMRFAAIASHYALYFCMFAMPLLGWAMLSAAGYPLVVGTAHVPAILPLDEEAHGRLWMAHRALGFGLFALIVLHIGAALFHALVRRDGVFESMAPGVIASDDAQAAPTLDP